MHSTFVRSTARHTAIVVAALSLAATTGAVPAGPAHAAPVSATSSGVATDLELRESLLFSKRRAAQRTDHLRAERRAHRRAARLAATRGERIVELAMREAGRPYVYGADGPTAFDCSGLTKYVFAQLGISLPHNAAAQAAMAQRVGDPQVGDLAFFGSGHVYHVGIYAGDGYIWHAPFPGAVVRKEHIWTSDVFFGRIG